MSFLAGNIQGGNVHPSGLGLFPYFKPSAHPFVGTYDCPSFGGPGYNPNAGFENTQRLFELKDQERKNQLRKDRDIKVDLGSCSSRKSSAHRVRLKHCLLRTELNNKLPAVAKYMKTCEENTIATNNASIIGSSALDRLDTIMENNEDRRYLFRDNTPDIWRYDLSFSCGLCKENIKYPSVEIELPTDSNVHTGIYCSKHFNNGIKGCVGYNAQLPNFKSMQEKFVSDFAKGFEYQCEMEPGLSSKFNDKHGRLVNNVWIRWLDFSMPFRFTNSLKSLGNAPDDFFRHLGAFTTSLWTKIHYSRWAVSMLGNRLLKLQRNVLNLRSQLRYAQYRSKYWEHQYDLLVAKNSDPSVSFHDDELVVDWNSNWERIV